LARFQGTSIKCLHSFCQKIRLWITSNKILQFISSQHC
jgi:hypothetical protein